MTVCIAAIAREDYIVHASDTMVSCFLSSSDASVVKLEEFHKDWAALMAAADLTQCIPIVDRAKTNFEGRANKLHVARACFKRAYQQHLAERRTDQVLSKFSTDMKEFKQRGKKLFTESVYNALASEIREVKGECDFLIYGYDSRKAPHLFTVNDPGTDQVYDKPGFCAIGTGLYAATGMLYHLGQTVDLDVYQTIFNVCAAKFMAEKASDVGRDTFLFVKKQGCNSFHWPSPQMLTMIRNAWETKGQPRVPEGIVEQLRREEVRCY